MIKELKKKKKKKKEEEEEGRRISELEEDGFVSS